MYSKVRIAGHPVHPMLIPFPVTFYVVTLLAYAIYGATADTFWFRAGWYANAAAIVCALVAAVPGVIDWATGIPRGTPAKTVGLWHMVANTVSLLLFVWALFATRDQFGVPQPAQPAIGDGLTLAAIGVAVTLVAGYLGWSLVQTHHVGVQLTREQERLEPQPSPDAGSGRPLGRPITH